MKQNSLYSILESVLEYDYLETPKSRVFELGEENGFVFLSADKGEDEKFDRKNFNEMKKTLKSKGLGFTYVKGVYGEEEDTLFIPNRDEEFKKFLEKYIIPLAAKYKQESIFVKEPEKDPYLLFLDEEDWKKTSEKGETLELGQLRDITGKKAKNMYSEFKRKKKGKTITQKGTGKKIKQTGTKGFRVRAGDSDEEYDDEEEE